MLFIIKYLNCYLLFSFTAQPPGVPEISKKSLASCPATGGQELFILGKNFLKDTLVHLQQKDEAHNIIWEQSVVPDKEFLQQVSLTIISPNFSKYIITTYNFFN